MLFIQLLGLRLAQLLIGSVGHSLLLNSPSQSSLFSTNCARALASMRSMFASKWNLIKSNSKSVSLVNSMKHSNI
jgi:hypothetical protein